MKSNHPVTRTIVAGLALSLLAFSAATVLAMDADELIKKSIEATGGLDKIKSVKTVKATGKFLAQGMEFPFSMTQKRPGKMRIDAEVMGATMTQCYADGKGWSINPMTGSTEAQPMSELEEVSFKVQSDMDGILVDYADKGYTVEYLGEDEVEGTETYKLKVDTQDGLVLVMYFDKEYFLNIKSESKITLDENEFETQTYLSDFQEVEGLVQPFSIETRSGDQVLNQIMMEKVELGLEVEDSLFEKPAAPAAPSTPVKE